MNNKTIKGVMTALLTPALIFPALANASNQESDDFDERPHIYIGANYGYLKVKDADDFNDDNDAIQALIGVSVNPYVAIEGGYIDFGSYGSNAANADTDGKTLGLKLILPLTNWFAIYAKGGQLWWDSEYEVLGIGGDSDGDEPFYGVGASFGLTDRLDLNVEYMRYEVELEADEVGLLSNANYESDLDHASVGLSFKF